jgi:hypothetical protein
MNKQVLSNEKTAIDIRRRLYQAIVVNIGLWGSENWALKEEDRSKLEAFHHSCLRRMCNRTTWDITEIWITNEKGRRTAANSPTMESMMEVRRCRCLSKLSVMEKLRSPRRMLGAWCPTPRPTRRSQQTTPCLHSHSQKPVFEQEKGQLREWITVARETDQHGEQTLNPV